jgi:putative iron-regulated protein
MRTPSAKMAHLILLNLLFALFLWGCDKNKSEDDLEAQKQEALEKYAEIVLANYDDCIERVQLFSNAVDSFLLNPGESRFEACKTAWLNARNPYGQSEAFRFYSGPIDDADGPEGLINAWPMDEAFVDYVAGMPDAGIINNPATYPSINADLLVGLNELFSEESIFSGFHAAEFLLWGQDFDSNGPGQRPYTDFLTGVGGTANHQDRRALYLQVVCELLLKNLNEVRQEWVGNGAYRTQFLTQFEAKKAMGLIFSGLEEFTKGEIAGERMFVAIDIQDQEHEHSCFSDNTLTDLKMNIQGVRNVYFGEYVRIDGAKVSGRNFHELALKIDAGKANALASTFEEVNVKLDAIPVPFDQAILNQKATIESAILSIHNLSAQLHDMGVALGAEY